MADNIDIIDGAGLCPGAAQWQLPPDQGISLNDIGWRHPTFGGDAENTTAYPSQEPQASAPWPHGIEALVASRNANPIAHGAESRNVPAEGAAPDPSNIPGPWKR